MLQLQIPTLLKALDPCQSIAKASRPLLQHRNSILQQPRLPRQFPSHRRFSPSYQALLLLPPPYLSHQPSSPLFQVLPAWLLLRRPLLASLSNTSIPATHAILTTDPPDMTPFSATNEKDLQSLAGLEAVEARPLKPTSEKPAQCSRSLRCRQLIERYNKL